MQVKWKWKYHYRMQLLHVSSVTCFFTNSEQISLKWTSIVILAPRMFLISFGISWRTRAAKFVKFWVKWMVKGPCNEIRVHGWEHSSNCIWNILWTSPHDKGKVFVSPQIEFTCCLPVQIHPWKLRTYLIWSQKILFQKYSRFTSEQDRLALWSKDSINLSVVLSFLGRGIKLITHVNGPLKSTPHVGYLVRTSGQTLRAVPTPHNLTYS